MKAPEDCYAKLALQLQRGLPFAAWSAPGSDCIKLVFQEDATVNYSNDYSESGFVFAPFRNEKKALFIPSEHYVCYNAPRDAASTPGADPVAATHSGKAAHLQRVSRGIEAIEKGFFKKVVLSRSEEVALPGPNVIERFKKLLYTYPEAFCYFWFHPQTGAWLGATPEILLKVNGHRFETMALATTQKAEGTATVSWNEKEKEEQQLVSDFIMAQLQPLARELTASDVYTARAGNLLHLSTDIKGKLRDKGPRIRNLLKALHPTPAVCGYPREAAKQFILENEDYDREFYTGFLGELRLPRTAGQPPEQQALLYVNLRCMKIAGNTAVLYIGGGINKGSVPENEWQETVNKAQTMRRILL